jgi:ABC-type antimicrobial peptide transport system permease subunit
MVLRQVAGMTVGVALGLAGALALGRAAQTLLFEMPGHDPIVLSTVALTVTLVAFGAGSVPAYLASRVDPMVALRPEQTTVTHCGFRRKWHVCKEALTDRRRSR